MDQLIEIWQTVGTDQRTMDKKYRPDDLIPQVVKLQRNQKQVLRFKTYGAMTILFVALLIFMSQFTLELYSLLGMGIITVSILGSVMMLNRKRFRITDEERSLSTHSLVRKIEAKLNAERKLFTVYLPVLLLVIILGINLVYYGYLSTMETKARLLYHLILTISMVMAFFLGLSVRIKRFRKRYLPLLNRIQEFKKASD